MSVETRGPSTGAKVNQWLERFSVGLGWTAGLMALSLGFVMGYQIFTREINMPTDWTFDVSIYLFIWLGFLGGSYTMRQRNHITMELVVSRLPRKPQRIIWFISVAVAIAYLSILFYHSWGQMVTSFLTKRTTIGTVHIPMWINHASLVVGSFVLMVELIRQSVCEALGLPFRRHRESEQEERIISS